MDPKKTVLVVAEDATFRAGLAQLLLPAGYAVELAEGTRRAREVIAGGTIDLGIIMPDRLDRMMPEVVRQLADTAGGLLIVADHRDTLERLRPLADGCVVTSSDSHEILQRVNDALRPARGGSHAHPSGPQTLAFEGFTLDMAGHALIDAIGHEVPLTGAEFALLVEFSRHPARVLSRDQLRGAVSGRGAEAYDRSIDVMVSRLRRKIGDDPKTPRLILTVPGVGYKFVGQKRAATATASVRPQAVASAPAPAVTTVTALPSPAPSPTDRRQLTVLACDFVGMAALSARLDPEVLRATTAQWHGGCAAIVERYHGHVARHLDDGVLVYFGYPTAREHDAEHAVRAGLDLLASAAGLGDGAQAPLQVRIGIANGVVAFSDEIADGGMHQPTAVGETPHRAKRLQAAAEAGTLIIDRSTRRLIGGLFEYRDLGDIGASDGSGAISAWHVLRPSLLDSRFEARGDADRPLGPQSAPSVITPEQGPLMRTRGGLSPYVGRERELELLVSCLPQATAHARVIDIVGEPGIGKSRLLHELRGRLGESRTSILSGSCWPDDRQTPFRPFLEVVRRAFRLEAGDPEAEVARKLKAGLAVLVLASEQNLGLLLNLLGLQPPAGALDGLDDVLVGLRTRDLLLRLAHERSRVTPVVMLLEDLHWIDGASQEILARLIADSDPGMLVIIHTRRPEYLPPWLGQEYTTTMALQPLAASETAQIVRARLGVSELTRSLARLIVDRAEGNPLFAEEIANFLIEAPIPRRHAAGPVDDAAVAAALPASLQSLLTARLDRLATEDRALLQAAAVIGRSFAPDLLAVATRSGRVEACLPAMERLDLVRRDGPSQNYVFKHVLVRDALYAGLLSAKRKALHRAIANEIERRHAGHLSEVAETLAHHYAQASHTEKAVEYLAMSGKKSLGIYSLDEAEHALGQALALARSLDPQRMEGQVAAIMADLAVVLYLEFKSSETVALIEPELQRIDALGDSAHAAILLHFYGNALFTRCRFHEGRQVEDKALAMAERIGDGRSKAHARTGVILLSILVDPMPLDEFERFAEGAFADADRGNDTFVIGRMMMAIAWNYLNRGLSLEGRRWAYRLMTFGRDRQDQRSQGMALWLLGWLDIVAEDYVSALGHGEECTRTALAPFDRQMSQQVVGISQVLLGRIEEGCETLRRHQQVAVANEWHYATMNQPILAVSMLRRGDIKQGVKQLEAAIRTCEIEYGYQACADFARLYLAEFYIALLQRTGKMSFVTVLRSPLFILNARRVAARRADALLTAARRNTQFSDRGVFRARIDFNLGLLQKATGRSDLARSHLSEARIVALAQEAVALVGKIDAAMASL